jgi:hypothetical protein
MAGHSPTLLMFAHPRCPCTRATLSELARVMARTGGRMHASVEFIVPPGEDPQWAQTDLWRSAAAIPETQVRLDTGGTEARRFGSATSGQVLVYDAAGRLCFAGGITAGRGHAGDNSGEDAVVAIANGGTGPLSHMPVYGCPLASPSAVAEMMKARCPK